MATRYWGPAVRDGGIVYDELTSAADLPVGWTDEQNGGTYSAEKAGRSGMFDYAVGLWQATREGDSARAPYALSCAATRLEVATEIDQTRRQPE